MVGDLNACGGDALGGERVALPRPRTLPGAQYLPGKPEPLRGVPVPAMAQPACPLGSSLAWSLRKKLLIASATVSGAFCGPKWSSFG
jgi:hypothetical protein